MIKEGIKLERLFFDFDSNMSGTLTLGEFTNLIYFLKINANKQTIKMLFDAVDADLKGSINLIEFKQFIEESAFTLKQQEDNSGKSVQD